MDGWVGDELTPTHGAQGIRIRIRILKCITQGMEPKERRTHIHTLLLMDILENNFL